MIVQGETEADLSLEAKNLKWATELAQLTARVEALFAERGKKHEPPSKEACGIYANALMAMRARIDAAPIRQNNMAAGRLRPDVTSSLQAAHKSGVALLHHLEPIRRRLADTFYEIEAMGLDAESFNAKLTHLDAAVEAVEVLLPVLDEPPLAPWPEGNPIRFASKQAQEAWASANDGDWPWGTAPNGPLVQVVVGALALIGICEGKWNVSMVLRNLRQSEGGTK